MLRWALIFVIIALLAPVFGIGGISGTALHIARILLLIFVVLLVVHLITGRSPVV